MTTEPALTEAFHRFRRERIQEDGEDRPGNKTTKYRRTLVSQFGQTLDALEVVVVFPEAGAKVALDHAAFFGRRHNPMYDFADFHLMTLARELNIDAIVSVDARDMFRLKKAMGLNLDPVLLLLTDSSLPTALADLKKRAASRQTEDAIAAIESQRALSSRRRQE